jgi:hypothetical protein
MSQATQARKQLVFDPHDFVRAAALGDARALEKSLAAGADVNASIGYGETALIAAAAAGRADMVRLLLRSGADVDARRDDGFNALIIAAFLGHKEGVRALLEYSADVTGRDRTGMTARGWALSIGHFEVANLLREAELAATRRASRLVSPAPAAPLSVEPVMFEGQGAPPETPAPILEAGTATVSTAAAASMSDAESDGEATLIAPAKLQAVSPAETPHVEKRAEETPAAAPPARAAQSPRRPANSYVDDRTESSYSLSRLIMLALISGLTAGATFFTVNWMMPPARTETLPARPAVNETPQPQPQEQPKPETPKQQAKPEMPKQQTKPETPKEQTKKPGAAQRPATSSAAEQRVATPDRARADKHARGKPETPRLGQPVLVSAHVESTSGDRPVSEHVSLTAGRQKAPRPAQPVGRAGGEGSVTVTPRASATPRRAEPQTPARPAQPLALPPQPERATPKKVIRWP